MDQFLAESAVELRLSAEQLGQICQQAERLAPEEACGLLAGSGAQVLKAYPVTNTLHSPVRYRMDPAEQLKVFLEIEQKGLELVGIYHSHPNGPDHPSQTDLHESYYPEVAYLILSPERETWRCRAFRIRDGLAHEVVVRMSIPDQD